MQNKWNNDYVVEKLKSIRKFESIDRNYRFQQQEQLSNTLNVMNKNVKILRYNHYKTIDNGFFGL